MTGFVGKESVYRGAEASKSRRSIYLLLNIISVFADLVGVSDKIVFIFSVISCESCQLFCKREVVVLVRTGV